MAVVGGGTRVIQLTAAGDEISGQTFVRYLRWVDSTTNGHLLSVTDSAGNEVFSSASDGAGFLDVHPVSDIMDGVKVPTMGSGRLFVYVR